MGNEQSAGSSQQQTNSPSSFSFLARASTKRSKGIVVVKGGNAPQESIEDDENYKHFLVIPRFMPIIPAVVGKKDAHPLNQNKMSSRPFFKFASRIQEHLQICAKFVTTDENKVVPAIKHIDTKVAQMTDLLKTRKANHEKFLAAISSFQAIQDEVMRIQLLLEDIVPVAETLNELLVPEDRLAPLNLAKVLNRTPLASSGSSAQSTPRQHLNVIAPIEEIQVIDLVDT